MRDSDKPRDALLRELGALRALRRIHQLVAQEVNPQRVLDGACASLVEGLDAAGAWLAILDVEGAHVAMAASAGYDGGFEPLRAQLDHGEFPPCMTRALGEGGAQAYHPPAEACSGCVYADRYDGRVALAHRLEVGGEVYGAVSVSLAADQAYDGYRGLFEAIADDLALALREVGVSGALRENRRRYREIFEGNRDGCVMVDASGRIIDANPAYCAMLGYSLQELRAMENFYAVTPARWRAWEEEEIWGKRLLKQGYSGLYEKEYIRKDGTVFPVELQSYAVRDGAGEILYLWGVARDITERKAMEEALRSSEERLDLALEAVSDGLWDWDVATNQVFFDARYYTMAGYEPNAFPGRFEEWAKRVHPDDIEAAQAGIEAHLKGATRVFDIEFRFRRADGAYMWIRGRGRIVARGDDGAPLRMTGTHTDITGRKQAEEKLRQSEAMLARTEGIAHVGSWEWDVETDTVMWSEELYRIFQRDPALGPPSFAEHDPLYVPEDMARLREAVERTAATGAPYEIELRARRADGALRYCVALGHADDMVDGRARRLFGALQDITPYKRAEEAYSRVCRMAAELICVADIETATFTQVNPAFMRVLGHSEKALLSRPFIEFVHPDDVAATQAVVEEQLKAGEPVLRFENRYRCADGSYRHLTWNSHPVSEEGLVYAIAHDVTARKQAEEARDKLEEQYRQAQKMEAVGHLAGGVAHDFNNILQAINGFTELARDDLPKDHAVQESLGEVAGACKRAARLVSQLLAFSRRQVLRPQYIDMNDVVIQLAKMLPRLLGEDVQLDFIPGRRLGTVYADPSMMEQIVMNLAVNARDAMPGGGRLCVETESVLIDAEYCGTHAWAKPGRYVLLSVSDTGCGMDKETLEQAFEPFFTTKEQGKGTGLGLSMVFGIVKQHDGMINAYSELGAGTTFKIYLPVAQRDASAVGPKIEAAPKGGTETILIAEDDDLVLALGKRILERAGYTVLTAANGEEAVQVFEEHADEVDLLLLDVVMPGVSGSEAYKRISEKRPGVPVLFASGYSENAVHNRFMLKEGVRLIQKPFARTLLLRQVRDVLDARDAS